jgi:hypothetical protein
VCLWVPVGVCGWEGVRTKFNRRVGWFVAL